MENLELQGWIKNTTGECPVEAGTIIDVMYTGYTGAGLETPLTCYHVKARVSGSINAGGYMEVFKDDLDSTWSAKDWCLDGDFDIGYWRLHDPLVMQQELGEVEE